MTKSVNGETVEYKYQENSDKLVAFGNETFEYDGVGNPTRYRNMTAEWSRGRVLTRLTDGTNTVEYTYDGRGYRTSKKVIGANATYTVTYIYAEGKLLREETGTKTIDYIYGSSGIIGIKRNVERYLFRKNMFGDVTHIYNESGEVVGKYSYTAFGECTIELDTNGVASDNPIRYRSYYYDDETSLYYLKTRYYDPELGRFMTIDGISYLNSNAINGLNLYAYCRSNPVMYIDSNGTDAILITAYEFGPGLPIVGHSAVLLEVSGVWYITQFRGEFPDKSTAWVECRTLGEKYDNDVEFYINDIYKEAGYKVFKGYNRIDLYGDYSDAYNEAMRLSDKENSEYTGNYNLFTRNCWHYAQHILSFAKGETNTIAMNYFNNTNNIIPGLVPLSIGLQNTIDLVVSQVSTAWESSNTKQFIDSIVNWFSRNIKLW